MYNDFAKRLPRPSTKQWVQLKNAVCETAAMPIERDALAKTECCILGCGNLALGEGPSGRIVHRFLTVKQGDQQIPKPIGWACPACTEWVLRNTGQALP